MENKENILLEIKDLKTHFFTDEGVVKAVDGATLTVPRAGTIGIVGESGCGKSITAYSIIKLIEHPGKIVNGQILYHRLVSKDSAHPMIETLDLVKVKANSPEMRHIRGGEISMIFQEPMTSLSPVHTIADQISENIMLHRKLDKAAARRQTTEMLKQVGIPKAETRLDVYPFQLSGGMRQRVMIAMALSCHPSMLIADEPTTALDVTTQAQILELMLKLQKDLGMTIMMITHNLGVVAEICQSVVVMYLGEVAEQADTDSLFFDPLHPYTKALLRSIPKLGQRDQGRLDPIKGMVPDPYNRPTGCPFHPRCTQKMPGKCDKIHPELIHLPDGRAVRCLLYGE